MRILIGYDGSPGARAAVREAARLFGSDTATIVTVWDDFPAISRRARAGLPSSVDFEGIDAASRQLAWEYAEEGTSHARAGGLAASALAVPRTTSIADTILQQADALDVDMIVLGSRGLAGLRSMLLGSTARAALGGSSRPVLVVPAPAAQAAGGILPATPSLSRPPRRR
jgi:nucleotide-binding universal stress UspA family protein